MLSIPVLLYHCIAPNKTAPEDFERQLAYLSANGYSTPSLSNFYKFLSGKCQLPEKSVLLTFDDGYADNWVCAYPLLKRYGLNAVVFLTTDRIGNGAPRKTTEQGAAPIMFSGQHPEAFLSWAEVELMARDGVFEIGSHTKTHNDFNNRRKWADMEAELAGSAEVIFSKTGRRPNALAWPWGYFTPPFLEYAANTGYQMAFTTQPGSNASGTSPLEIHRFNVQNGDIDWLARRLWVYGRSLPASLYGSVYGLDRKMKRLIKK